MEKYFPLFDQRMPHNNRYKHNGHHRHQFDQNIDAWARGILKRITDGVTDDAGLMGSGSFAAVNAFFNIFFGIVPCPAGISHHDRQDKPGGRRLKFLPAGRPSRAPRGGLRERHDGPLRHPARTLAGLPGRRGLAALTQGEGPS